MRADPDYFDAKRAGRWLWGICAWIGSGWCATSEYGAMGAETFPRRQQGQRGQGIHASADPASKVRIAGHNKGSSGKGVHAQGELHEKRPCLGQPQRKEHGGSGTLGRGVHGSHESLSQKRPQLDGNANGKVSNGGVHARPHWTAHWDLRAAAGVAPGVVLQAQGSAPERPGMLW
jgi:hypothetical protein